MCERCSRLWHRPSPRASSRTWPRSFRGITTRLLEAAGIARELQPPEDPLIERAAELAVLDPPQARRAVEAVLQTLAVRISEGEVRDLMDKLPPNLRPPLERGLSESRKATPMSLEEFLGRVAELEGIDGEEAELHVRAVFAALSDYVSSKEAHDGESELPKEYAPLFSGVI